MLDQPSPVLPRRVLLGALAAAGLGTACGFQHEEPQTATTPSSPSTPASPPSATPTGSPELGELKDELGGQDPKEWGLETTGVVTAFTPSGFQAVLTLDACGGPEGNGYDAALIETLRSWGVPATLFINKRWAQEHRAVTQELIEDPLFEIANHGTEHKPLSVTGETAYGVQGTGSLSEVYEEIMDNQRFFRDRYDLHLPYFRPGTAYTDEVAARAAEHLGTPVVNFSVNGDGGATMPAEEVRAALSGVGPGDIVIGHFNQPASGTAEGIAAALPELAERGIEWATLGDVL